MPTVRTFSLQFCDVNSAFTHPTYFQSDITTITTRRTHLTLYDCFVSQNNSEV